MTYIDKIPQATVVDLKQLIDLADGEVTSRTLVQRPDLTLTLFAVGTGEEIGGHEAAGDAMVNVLSGVAEITIADQAYMVAAGQTIVIPAGQRHSLYAKEGFQMLLTVVKPAQS
ncbi:cupin domain-containing protein [Lacticaseibacillus camelliae]|uniref:Cupin type-2 domain-containing protein n=1 Tax=Lacticaseibacillus camelliae DSM 22697 = JCM 13995 TaxID=1423730 RepID=A0A0R2EP45_9LACO|nr:cupin domain-containing protein [Lacticaseibacillus camelliae]KRN18178.1 hypothetical protein FC75_GL000870 [Lacticaseibacillus camelliae DSM 22697 = JCM 13995]